MRFCDALQLEFEALTAKFPRQVRFGHLEREAASYDNILVWAANADNWEGKAGESIDGGGQAAAMRMHGPGVFGIITTPTAGMPPVVAPGSGADEIEAAADVAASAASATAEDSHSSPEPCRVKREIPDAPQRESLAAKRKLTSPPREIDGLPVAELPGADQSAILLDAVKASLMEHSDTGSEISLSDATIATMPDRRPAKGTDRYASIFLMLGVSSGGPNPGPLPPPPPLLLLLSLESAR